MTETQSVSPDFWAVHSATGIHIGLWPDKADAEEVLREYEGGAMTPLYKSATLVSSLKVVMPSELAEKYVFAPREPTPEMIRKGVDLAMRVAITGEYRWVDYIADLYRTMIKSGGRK